MLNIRLTSPCGSDSKESAFNAGDPGSIPGSGRCPGEGMAIHSSILLWRILWTEQPGYSVHGILQRKILEGIAIPSPGHLPDLGIEPGSPALQGASLPTEPPGNLPYLGEHSTKYYEFSQKFSFLFIFYSSSKYSLKTKCVF